MGTPLTIVLLICGRVYFPWGMTQKRVSIRRQPIVYPTWGASDESHRTCFGSSQKVLHPYFVSVYLNSNLYTLGGQL
jgi:hypothetical protein